jgi:hypothetical protein
MLIANPLQPLTKVVPNFIFLLVSLQLVWQLFESTFTKVEGRAYPVLLVCRRGTIRVRLL